MGDPGLSSGDEWAFEIWTDQLIAELGELLRTRNASEVAKIMAARRARRRRRYRPTLGRASGEEGGGSDIPSDCG
jgi:hypothetical protein